jgi:hypothetical protein
LQAFAESPFYDCRLFWRFCCFRFAPANLPRGLRVICVLPMPWMDGAVHVLSLLPGGAVADFVDTSPVGAARGAPWDVVVAAGSPFFDRRGSGPASSSTVEGRAARCHRWVSWVGIGYFWGGLGAWLFYGSVVGDPGRGSTAGTFSSVCVGVVLDLFCVFVSVSCDFGFVIFFCVHGFWGGLVVGGAGRCFSE